MIKEEIFVSILWQKTKTKAFVTIYGDKNLPQILCLHGIGSTGQRSFENIAPFLTEKYQLIVIDWIGWGQSSRPLRDIDTYDTEYCSLWFQLFIQNAIEQKILHESFYILAVSMSAIPLAYSYEKLKRNILSIILINPAGFDTHISKIFSFILTHPMWNHEKLAHFLMKPIIWRKILHWSDHHKERLINSIKSRELELFIRYAKAGIRPNGLMKSTHILPEKFTEIKKPVLLIHSRDQIFYRKNYVNFAKKHKWKDVEMKMKSHTPAVQKPKETAEVILDFLENKKII